MKIVETYKTILGETYTLYNVGKGYKTVIESPSRTLKSGKIIDGFVTEREHRTLQAAMNSKLRAKAAH